MGILPLNARSTLIAATLVAVLSSAAAAGVVPGDPAPDFIKNELDALPPAARSLANYPDRILVFFLLGYN
jgi:hypothetical protein